MTQHSQGGEHRHTNRLIHETSQYLLKHAHNPVDWYAWGPDAQEAAKRENKPIHLSVGYLACYWCTRLEQESFENEDTAAFLNANFINIKVDREERPDIDTLYMAAVQAMTGHGGWPMTVFLTPEGRPFFGGTYFPPEPRYGMPSFMQVLTAVSEAFRDRREDIDHNAGVLTSRLQDMSELPAQEAELSPRILDAAVDALQQRYDKKYGGFGGAPKFPQAPTLEVLLRDYRRTGDGKAMEMLTHTLRQMADGGIYDQLGWGFHRYATDATWTVPHFEKMLYDNAQLARLYIETWQVTGEPRFRQIAEQVLAYVKRDMTAPDGGFYAAEDATTDGEEGKYYVWTMDEIREALTLEQAELAIDAWGVTAEGNFEGHVVLTAARSPEKLAGDGDSATTAAQLDQVRQLLLARRGQRERPARDEKIIASWNGMMLRAVALAARVFESEEYLTLARRDAEFLLGHLWRDGRLMRVYKDGRAHTLGFLEDYALLADGLIELYQASFEQRWLEAARDLTSAMVELFYDDENGFFDTSTEHEQLITRPRDPFDNATPSGTSAAVDVLLRLAALLGEPDHQRLAVRVLKDLSAGMASYPTGFGRMLSALDTYLGGGREIAIVGEQGAEDTLALLRVVNSCYLPTAVIAAAAPGDAAAPRLVPLLADRPQLHGRATAYVCANYTCQHPTDDPAVLAAQLG